jgi:hypothetical protein
MTVYVLRDGRLVEKANMAEAIADQRSIFPAPMLSRIEPFESPVTGKEISSWRERDRDMAAVDAVDLRDLPRDHQFKRGRAAQAKEANSGRTGSDEPFWRDPA